MKRRYEALTKVENLLSRNMWEQDVLEIVSRLASGGMRWRNIISRDALSGSLELSPMQQIADGIGVTSETFSNIKTPAATKKRRAQTSFTKTASKNYQQASTAAARLYRPRYLAHLGLMMMAGLIVVGNNPSKAHSLSVRLLSAGAGYGASLDATATANVAADIADKSHLLVAGEASQTATKMNDQVALLTSDDMSLAKRQVVATAGNATRDITSYVVQDGDTLSSIASKFNITSSTVKWANNLDDADAIKPGQSLVILPITGLEYTVQAGDTAESLANTYQANAAQILSYNNAEVKGLVPGTKIIIPDGTKAEAPKPVVATTHVAAAAAVSPEAPQLTHFSGGGNSYAYGYCTYYVASRRSVPPFWGDARNWYYNAQASGFSVGSTPVPGAIAWTGAGYYGHVAYVESVSGGNVTVSEMNFNGNWNRVTYRTVSASSFLYIY